FVNSTERGKGVGNSLPIGSLYERDRKNSLTVLFGLHPKKISKIMDQCIIVIINNLIEGRKRITPFILIDIYPREYSGGCTRRGSSPIGLIRRRQQGSG